MSKKANDFFNIRIVWVRSHDKDWGNQQADKHAGEGADIKDEDHASMRRPRDWRLSEFRRDFPHRFANSQNMALHLFQGAGGDTTPPPA